METTKTVEIEISGEARKLVFVLCSYSNRWFTNDRVLAVKMPNGKRVWHVRAELRNDAEIHTVYTVTNKHARVIGWADKTNNTNIRKTHRTDDI